MTSSSAASRSAYVSRRRTSRAWPSATTTTAGRSDQVVVARHRQLVRARARHRHQVADPRQRQRGSRTSTSPDSQYLPGDRHGRVGGVEHAIGQQRRVAPRRTPSAECCRPCHRRPRRTSARPRSSLTDADAIQRHARRPDNRPPRLDASAWAARTPHRRAASHTAVGDRPRNLVAAASSDRRAV